MAAQCTAVRPEIKEEVEREREKEEERMNV